jgi:hypothetical protein
MRKTRLVAAILTAAALSPMATAAPAVASANGPMPITTWTTTVKPHQPTWIDIFWATNKKICDAQVTVVADRVDVFYPTNTATFTSFSQSDRLKPRRVDYTAVRVTAHHSDRSFVPLTVTIAYNTCGRHAVDETDVFGLTLPVLKNATAT